LVAPKPWALPCYPGVHRLGIGAAVALSSLLAASFRPHVRWLWTLSIGVLIVTSTATIWTFWFSLPTSIAWDSAATLQAKQALNQVELGPKNAFGVPAAPCVDVANGHIGPLLAPYRECAVSTYEGHFVVFTAVGSRLARGLGFSDIGAGAFPDECVRHLAGEWWMFVSDSSGIGDCPIGYTFHGGG
jgi:hypothetical protein